MSLVHNYFKWTRELGIHKLGHRKLLLKHLKELGGTNNSPIMSRRGSIISHSESSNSPGRSSRGGSAISDSSHSPSSRSGSAISSSKRSARHAQQVIPRLSATSSTNPATWSCNEVQAWLLSVDEQEISSLLSSIDGLALLSLDDATLERLGVSTIGQRKRLLTKLRDLNV